MSLQVELGLTDEELKDCDHPTQAKITEQYTKYKLFQLLSQQTNSNRDSQRLDAKARAAYKNLGFAVGADIEDEVVLGDKTITSGMTPRTASILVLGLLGASAIAAWALTQNNSTQPAGTDTNTTYKVEKWTPDQ